MPDPVWDSIVLHHTYNIGIPDREFLDWASIVNNHVNILHNDFVGYHAGIERVKGHLVICLGRPLIREGAHCLGMNFRALGLAIIGNYDLEPPDRELCFTTAWVCKFLMLRYPAIKVESIFPHSDFSTKSCPGKMFDVEKVRYLIRNTV